MVPWRASEEGFATEAVIDWYARFAAGRPGALVVEATGIRDVPSGPLLRIGDDRFLPGLERLVAAVRRASGGETRLFIQLIDFLAIRRRPDPETFFRRYLRITERHRAALGMADAPEAAVRERLLALDPDARDKVLDARERESLHRGHRERVTDTHLPHIAALPEVLPARFAAAAIRARDAGFDGVELHEAVRAAVGDDFVVGCRFLSEECIAGGSTVEDAIFFATAFAGAGMDFLSLSRGGKFEDAAEPRIGEAAYPYTGPSGYECMPSFISDARGPFGRNLAAGARIRAAVRAAGHATPIVVTGGIHGFAQAESVLAQGQADIVGFARQALADPDWFRKVRSGRGEEVRVCSYSNYCEALDQKHKQVTCKLWDRLDLDAPGVKRTADGKRRLLPPPWEAAHDTDSGT